VKFRAEGLSDTGRTRFNNEDAYLIDDKLGLFLVSDGMGGHQAGEVASQLAIEVIQKYLSKKESGDVPTTGSDEWEVPGERDSDFSPEAVELADSIRLANRIIYQVGEDDINYRGMGCTVVALLLPGSGRGIVANVGDSRIYLIRDATILQLNEDHTLLNEYIKNDPDFMNKKEEFITGHLDHILVRALGSEPETEVDVHEIDICAGDRFLLCSDGLTDMLTDDEILNVVEAEKKLDKLCQKLVALANEKGGVDNITVVLVEIEEP